MMNGLLTMSAKFLKCLSVFALSFKASDDSVG